MTIFSDFFGGNSGSQSGPKGIKKLEQFCSQLGYPIADRTSSAIAVPFNTSIGPRHLLLSCNDTGQLGVATMSSGIQRPPGQLHSITGLYFLMRSNDMAIGAWKGEKSGDDIEFSVQYTYLLDGLTLQIFKSMCGIISEEVGSAIILARSKGWL